MDRFSLSHIPFCAQISRLETRYRQALHAIDGKFDAGLRTYVELERIHAKTKDFIVFLKTNAASAAETNHILDQYSAAFGAIHSRIISALAFHLTTIWTDDTSSRHTQKLMAHFRRLRTSPVIPEELIPVLSLRDSSPAHSIVWRRHHSTLVNMSRDILMRTAHHSASAMHKCFEKTILAASQTASSPQDIADWIDGYKPSGPAEARAVQNTERLIPLLKSCDRRRWIKMSVRQLSVAMLAGLIIAAIHTARIDKNIADWTHKQYLVLTGRDPASLLYKQKKAFFHDQITGFDTEAAKDNIRKQLHDFQTGAIYTQPHAYRFFARRVMKDLFLLLSKEPVPEDIKSSVLANAALLDTRLAKNLSDLFLLFENNVIHEKPLKALILELRRTMVSRGVFPFTFIIVHKGAPYLFFYPERILHIFQFTIDDLKRLELNADHYGKYMAFPLKIFVVNNRSYPFKDRAGYFEGEFAIVFAGIAPNAEWTAWHEAAHIVDFMRYKYGWTSLPRNIEINALLFPAIYGSDPKSYLLQRLVPILKTKDPGDMYVQAAKGIFNGLNMALSPTQKYSYPPLTNRLTDESIDAHASAIARQSNEAIKTAALQLFLKRDKYLSTAQPGHYHGLISNAEEVIAGTPRAPHQGYVLRGFGSGQDDPYHRSFQFDDSDIDLDFFKGKDLWTITKQLAQLLFNRSVSHSTGFHLANVIVAVVNFILIELIFLLVHVWASPYRKEQFHGRSLARIIYHVYAQSPVSDGRSVGGQRGEKDLLKAALSSSSGPSEEVIADIRALKSSSSFSQCAVFDTLLSLAPFQPEQSRIKSKWHDLIFWLPFIGPWIARHPWLFPGQKSFDDWKRFNRSLEQLALSITPQTTEAQFKQQYARILNAFKDPAAPHLPDDDRTLFFVQETSRLFHEHLTERPSSLEIRKPRSTKTLPWLNRRDGEFDHLAVYGWNDDITLIDWKATARSPNWEPKVKRYAGSAGTQVDFLINFRGLSNIHHRIKVSRDLSLAARHVDKNMTIRSLALIMPKGDVRQTLMPIPCNMPLSTLGKTIWDAIQKEFELYQKEHAALSAHDLTFYTQAENARYRSTSRHTSFDEEQTLDAAPKFPPFKSHHVYIIGASVHEQNEWRHVLPAGGQHYFWP